MRFLLHWVSLCALLLVVNVSAAQTPQQAEFFESKIRPLLVNHCQSCHGPEKQKGGLRLDSRAFLLKGTEEGPVILEKDPEKSPLLKAIRHDGTVKMPKTKLPDADIEALTAWVKMGTPWPASGLDPKARPRTIAEVRGSHWAFQPVKKPTPPAVKDAKWATTDIDRFILATLEANQLTPASTIDRRTLLRRLAFDLIGLPPTPEQLDAFEKDTTPDAVEKVIDQMLASPQYGERWGRHWLDIARYADTKGYVFTQERRYPFSYTYRDWVIDAFNRDLPYDQFLLYQLAADQMPLGDDKRPLAAMGFLTLGRRFLNNIHDIIDDRMDVTMRGLQGMTVGCARCHDHKYDPIPIKDYYSLYGVFASSIEPTDLPTITPPKRTPDMEAYEKELAALVKTLTDYKEKFKDELKANNRKHRDEVARQQMKIDALKVTHPGAPVSAMVLVDAGQPMNPQVFLRGNPGNRGPQVPRQFLEVIAGDGRKPFTKGSGRLELAQAIASKDNPLTARVMVNRLWQHHFGKGLVRTPSDFGLRGDPPTHPELLDWLAATFMEHGWSVKKMHKLILMSHAYQQASNDNPKTLQLDPDNRFVWKMNRQRLEFEALRDSLLFVAGRLDPTPGGKSVEITTAPFARRRTVYGFIERQNLPGVFRTFDFASPDSSTAQRHSTTVPQQALFLMNSPFVLDQATQLVSRSDVVALTKTTEKITRLYSLCYGRAPDADEITLGEQFLAEASRDGKTKAWQQYAQVLLLANEFCHVD